MGYQAAGPEKRQFPRWRELAPLLKPKPLEFDASCRRARAAADIADLRAMARRRVPRAVFDYVDGGADSEWSVTRSREAFVRIEFWPSVLRDVSSIDMTTTILGRPAQLPVVFGPTGFTRMMHHAGERAVARAATAAGIPYSLSTMGTTSIEEIASAIPGGRRWFQLYMWKDRAKSLELIQRAGAAGYEALILTVDTPVTGARLRDVRNGLTIPPALSARTFLNGAAHPSWWFNLLTTPPLDFASLNAWNGTVAELADQLFDPSVTMSDLAWLREAWPGKLIVKGIQSADDAVQAVESGADAVVVSNHGGRQLDRAPVPLEQLPAVVNAIGDRAEVYIDGGIMSGADVVAALCSGATAVLVGRAYLYGLMTGGEVGVRRVADLLADEMHRTMQLLGVASVKELTPERVRLRPR
jgi:L-lactate dehydrogenase (cytochrome)